MNAKSTLNAKKPVVPAAPGRPQRRAARRRLPGSWRRALWGYALIAPALLFVVGFTLLPILGAFGISLTRWDMIAPMTWAGFANYQKIVSDPVATKTLLNTFAYTLGSVPLGIAIALLLAILLNQKLRGLSFFRAAYYLPVISSTVAVSMIFLWIMDSKYGLLNRALGAIGIDPIPWLTSVRWAMPSVILVTIWRSLGFHMIIFLASLQDVPQDLYEASDIDGAGPLQKFVRITLPLMTPAIFFVSITGIISSFQSFDLVYNMTQGRPGRATYLIGYYIWEQAFKYSNLGYGAALAFVLFFLILVVTIAQWMLRRRWVFGEE